ncbi:hypothetical protein QAD02_011506 [Eretmocerus hayati]|uniref:Uncharacterized protein n=1 Tax=Eretmocerus hayati TaxID=131215 RepID=A0ACC2P1R7_9HYME|nr:hypothetical protein QAD02_011506 [Eretmocerus hayati]
MCTYVGVSLHCDMYVRGFLGVFMEYLDVGIVRNERLKIVGRVHHWAPAVMKSSQQEQPQPIISMDPVTVESSVNNGGGSSSCSSTGSNDYAYRPLTTTSKHRRAGSTGTTGDEEFSSDEDELYGDEADCCPVMGPGGLLIQPGVVDLKSDLARAATDLFGYAKHERGEDEEVEPTSLFDDDEQQQQQYSCSRSSKPVSVYSAYNTESGLASRRRLSNCSDKLKITSGSIGKSQQQQQQQQLNDDEEKDERTKTQPLDRRRRSSRQSLQKEQEQSQSEKSANICNGEFHESQAKTTTTTTTLRTLDLDLNTKPKVDSISTKTTSSDGSSKPDDHDDVTTTTTSDPPSPSTVQWGRAVAEVKEQAIAKLQDELRRAHEELKLKDEEVARLSRIRQDVEAELEELTASLFQEAHNMVREANQRQATAERLLEESRMKAEVLAAEVSALKTLVLTSTPAQPNPHLHPQIADETHHHHHHHHHNHHQSSNGGIFAKKHRRSPSHFNLKYGREGSPPESPLREPRTSLPIGTVNDIYWEITRLRKEMVLARLGLALTV